MSEAFAIGIAAGLGAAAISEALLRLWARRPDAPAMAFAFGGAALRTVWVLAALALGLGLFALPAAGFAAGLFTAYLASQVAEGLRYRRFVERR